MFPLRRANTLRIGQIYNKLTVSSNALSVTFYDPFGDAGEIPKRVGTTFPEIDVSKLKIRSKLNSIITGILSIFILIISIVENEQFYADNFKSTPSSSLLRAFIMSLNALLGSLIIQYYSIKLFMQKSYRECHINSNL